MKKYLNILRIASFIFVLTGYLVSCGNDDNPDEPLNKVLVGTKWTSQNWDYDIASNGEWAYYFEEVYTVYFYSETEAVAYYARKTMDSDEGSSHERNACFFKYNYNGKTITTEPITSPFNGFQSGFSLENDVLKSSIYNLSKGTINNNDYDWLNTIKGSTGDCRWYYNYSGGLTIAGEGNMADYQSYESTPWNSIHRAINKVYIHDGVKYVGAYAFALPSIGSVELPHSGLNKIGAYAFAESCIGTVDLYDVKCVEEGAFSGCNYANLNFDSEIEEICDFACKDCKYASLSMTPNLRIIGNSAFQGCEIKHWTDSKVLETIGGSALGKINTKEVELPAIKELGHLAFYNTKIERIHIGSNLQKITGTPFVDVSYSGTLTIDKSSPLTLNYSFIDDSYVKNWNLVVPEGSEFYYLNANYWKKFKSIIGSSSTGSNDSPNDIIKTIGATPGVFDVKLYGQIGTNINDGKVYFRVSKSPTFSEVLDTTSKLSVTQLSGQSYELTLSNNLEANTNYYYQAVYEYNSSNIKYGETKTFRTSISKKPSYLTYTIDGQTYKMVLVSGCISGDFYIMQTELPHSIDINVSGKNFYRLDIDCNEAITKTEWRKFINELRSQTGIAWRLPTAEEWKYAAKGGNLNKGFTYSGSNKISDVAWYSGNCSYAHGRALKNPNELGIYDMSGNYAELTYGKDLYDVDGPYYGGCWNDNASACKVTSYKPGSISGKIPGTKITELNAFNGKYITVRLVYSAR